MNRLAGAVTVLALVVGLIGGIAIHRVDRALKLWKCHAAVGYGHPAELDACLNL